MPSFPTIHSGTVYVKYPASRTRRPRTVVHQFCDFSEQRHNCGAWDKLTEFELSYRRVNTNDKGILRTFYIERQGVLDTTWDFPDFEGVAYQRCRFLNKELQCVKVGPDQWDLRFQIAGFRVPA
jgi:phage-related protein